MYRVQGEEVYIVNENEKEIIKKLSDTVPKLEKDKQSYILGVVEGMAIAKQTEKKEEQLQEV